MSPEPQQFSAAPERIGTRVGIRLPFVPSTVWGERARYHITGTVAGVTFRGKLQPLGDEWMLVLGPAWRRDHAIGPGDVVEVSLGLEGPQEANVAEDIAVALASNPAAAAFFEDIPTFYRKNFMRWIDSAKRPETRSARIVEMIGLLERGIRSR